MYMLIYIHIHVHIHVYVHVYVHVSVHVHVYTYFIGVVIVSLKATFGFPVIHGQLYSDFNLYEEHKHT